MSCVLRVGGEGFSAVEFLRDSGLRPYHVETDSFKVLVSEGTESDLPAQIADATEFLRAHFAALQLLPTLDEEEIAMLDFSQFVPSFYDFPAQFLHLPSELLKLAGLLGICIEVSQYAVSDEEKQP